MRYLKVKNIEYPVEIENGKIINIIYESVKDFLNLYSALKEENEEFILYSENFYKSIKLYKKSIFIPNLLDLNINDKKILSSLYKTIESKITKYDTKIYEINRLILELLNDIELEVDGELDYDESITISKIFSSYSLRFNEEDKTIFKRFINYLIELKNINNYEIIFIIDGLKYFNNDEINLLKNELEKLECCLINLSIKYEINSKAIEQIHIDDIGCVY